ncbi:MAG TPA: sulfite exporter TauE/SafE family protein [Jatrophihabitans sp.]|nr:sulfite exporter TauE/SafE family protein [Jatrophihabitans sp.]
MTLAAAALFGVLIGLSLGALGGGGSILTVPALVYAVGESAHAATTESLVIVGLTSLVAAGGHARAGHVRWGAGLVFGLTGVAASYVGTAANRAVDPNLLLLAFAGLIVVAATAMLLRQRGGARTPAAEPATAPAQDRTVLTRPVTGIASRTVTPAVAAKVLAAGLAVGFLTGFFGVGGGFVIVPALVMALGYDMPITVGTSLLVIAINSAAALLARSGHQTFHWSVIVPFTLAAIAGSLTGKRVADRVAPDALTRAFVGLLFAVAGYVAIRSGVALLG